MPCSYNPNPYMQMCPQQYQPMMNMPAEQLESMYPRAYFIIYPVVCQQCDTFASQFGPMYAPSRQQVDCMIDNIDNMVGTQVDQDYRDDDYDYDSNYDYDYEYDYADYDQRPNGFGGYGGFGGGHGRRRFRRDLVRILLLRELLHRRRYPHGGHHGGHFGY